MIVVIVLTIAIYVCPRIVMPQNFKSLPPNGNGKGFFNFHP